MKALARWFGRGDRAWAWRRRMAIAMQGLAAWMVVYGGVWAKSEAIAAMLITNGTMLSGSVLAAYITGAVIDDNSKRKTGAADSASNGKEGS